MTRITGLFLVAVVSTVVAVFPSTALGSTETIGFDVEKAPLETGENELTLPNEDMEFLTVIQGDELEWSSKDLSAPSSGVIRTVRLRLGPTDNGTKNPYGGIMVKIFRPLPDGSARVVAKDGAFAAQNGVNTFSGLDLKVERGDKVGFTFIPAFHAAIMFKVAEGIYKPWIDFSNPSVGATINPLKLVQTGPQSVAVLFNYDFEKTAAPPAEAPQEPPPTVATLQKCISPTYWLKASVRSNMRSNKKGSLKVKLSASHKSRVELKAVLSKKDARRLGLSSKTVGKAVAQVTEKQKTARLKLSLKARRAVRKKGPKRLRIKLIASGQAKGFPSRAGIKKKVTVTTVLKQKGPLGRRVVTRKKAVRAQSLCT